MDYKNDASIEELNKSTQIDYITALGFLFGIVLGIVIGSGIHDWLYHPLR